MAAQRTGQTANEEVHSTDQPPRFADGRSARGGIVLYALVSQEVKVNWQDWIELGIKQTSSGASALLGLLVGAAITYVLQSRLEARKRRDAEAHLAYALLVQVTGAAARFNGMRTATGAAMPLLEKAGMPQSPDFDHTDFTCALLGELLRSDDKMGEALRGFDSLLESMTDYLITG